MPPTVETCELFKTYSKRALGVFSKERDGAVALDSVNLRIEEGELCGLLGRNGAGKTTLIKILSTLILPTGGTARVNGFDILKDDASVRSSVGLISSDERSFYWRLSGRDNLLFFASLQKIPPAKAGERIKEVLDLVGLNGMGKEVFQNYSGGMKQRLSIARGLLHDPDVLFMDEPTKGLDPEAADRLRTFIRRDLVEGAGRTVLLATHNLAEAEEICDTVAIMHRGSLLAKDRLDTLIKDVSLKRLFVESAENVQTD